MKKSTITVPDCTLLNHICPPPPYPVKLGHVFHTFRSGPTHPKKKIMLYVFIWKNCEERDEFSGIGKEYK